MAVLDPTLAVVFGFRPTHVGGPPAENHDDEGREHGHHGNHANGDERRRHARECLGQRVPQELDAVMARRDEQPGGEAREDAHDDRREEQSRRGPGGRDNAPTASWGLLVIASFLGSPTRGVPWSNDAMRQRRRGDPGCGHLMRFAGCGRSSGQPRLVREVVPAMRTHTSGAVAFRARLRVARRRPGDRAAVAVTAASSTMRRGWVEKWVPRHRGHPHLSALVAVA